MDYGAVEQMLRSCFVERGDDDAARAQKRQRRQQAERDLEEILRASAPTADEAYELARILSCAGPGDLSSLRRARDLAELAHTRGHPEAGRLFAGCVDRLLCAEHKPQRYGTLRRTIAGEVQLPEMDAAVTDEERAGLGLPPAAKVRDQLEEANRQAAHDVAVHGLPEGMNLRRVLRGWTPAQLEQALGGRAEAVWRDGPDVVFCWRGRAAAVTAWFGIEMEMEPVTGTELWALAVRIRDADHASFSYRFLPARDGETRRRGERSGTWRGPLAPPEPERAQVLAGDLRTVELDSEALGERRSLRVYVPPGHQAVAHVPVLYATDGRVSAELIEPLVLAGRIPPIVSVGVPFGEDVDGDRRAQEYLPGLHPERFEAHRRFFVEEVSAWAERELGVAADRRDRAVFGVSNGAAFAASMGVRHPEHFGAVIAFSLAVTGSPPTWKEGRAPAHYLCAGTLEEGFARGTQRWAEVVGTAGAKVVHRSWVAGHDPLMWDGELPRALQFAFTAR